MVGQNTEEAENCREWLQSKNNADLKVKRMIGVPKEVKDDESRTRITPADVKAPIESGSNCLERYRGSIATRRLFQAFVFLAFVFATAQFVRSYFIVNQPYLNASSYESGNAKMPYQARILMAVVMRHARSSAGMASIAARLRGPLHEPDVLSLLLVNLLSLAMIAVVVRAFYRHLCPGGRLSSMPYFLVLWMASATYIVRFQQAIYFPYDLLAAALFTVCIYLCYRRRYLLLLPVFVLACFNRETIVMIVPLVLVNLFVPDTDAPRLSVFRMKEIPVVALMAAIWVVIYIHFRHVYAGNQTELGSRIHENLRVLASPQIWPQIASACGFLLPVPLLFWRLIPQPRLRFYTLLIPAWIAVMCVVGLLGESRIFGELIGFLAVLCTLLFELAYNANSAAAIPRALSGGAGE